MEIAYYPGCSLHASSELYDIQCKLVFDKLGLELKEIEDWNCCGATGASKTNEFLSIALPARNLGLADATGLSEILIPCASCYSRTLVSQKVLASDAALKETINAELGHKIEGKIKVSSILEVLRPKVDSGEIAGKAVKKLTGLKPACYYGCLLTRFPVDIDVPDNVENPQGIEVVCKALGADRYLVRTAGGLQLEAQLVGMDLIFNLALSTQISPPVRVPSEMLVDWVTVTR